MRTLSFPHPDPQREKPRIWPVFLPFHGCRQRCVYCSQTVQSGSEARPLSEHYENLKRSLELARRQNRKPLELGFFGGSFTGLPRPWPLRFLELAQAYRRCGLIAKIRFSTRPDMLQADDLAAFKRAGLDMVEVGVQSFSERVLQASGRGYTREAALQGLESVHRAGLELGVQLLPGLPEHTEQEWRQDIAWTVSSAPQTVRIYPCLVLQGTALARRWSSGAYRPWSLSKTVSALSRGVLALWRKDIRVIRIGLPAQAELVDSILAGPWHPALGGLVRGRIIRARIQAACLILGPGPKRLTCPERSRGEVWGHRSSNRSGLLSLGLSRGSIRYERTDLFRLEKI